MFSCSYIISPIEVEIKISNIPKRIEKVADKVRDFNGTLASWKGRGYKGPTPPTLIENMSELMDECDKFLKKYRGE